MKNIEIYNKQILERKLTKILHNLRVVEVAPIWVNSYRGTSGIDWFPRQLKLVYSLQNYTQLIHYNSWEEFENSKFQQFIYMR